MRKRIEANERIKREYLTYLKDAKGHDETTLDKVAAALVEFEEAIGFKPFKSFHRDWAGRFKKHLETRRNARTSKPLGVTTRDATLRLVKGFIFWLATQKGYKSKLTYEDAAYFNNNAREARAAHSPRPVFYPSPEQCAHAFRQMPEATEVERRNKAIFAFAMLTGARDSAIASLRLKHVDLVDRCVMQDGREVHTKNGKTIMTWFFPVDPMYHACFEAWVTYLRQDCLRGPSDALFPKQMVGTRNGQFAALGLSAECYGNGQPINTVVKGAFVAAGMRAFNAHSLRKTLAMLGDKVCESMEQRKSWSMNLGHEHLATTINSYLPVSIERQGELIKKMSDAIEVGALR